jgi:hypothetical protein
MELTLDQTSRTSSANLDGGHSRNSLHDTLVPYQKRADSADREELNMHEEESYRSRVVSRNHTPITAVGGVQHQHEGIFSDLAGNVYKRGDSAQSRSHKSSDDTKPLVDDNSKASLLLQKRHYMRDAYRPNSKTGSPRPASPSELSNPGEDYSPRVKTQLQLEKELLSMNADRRPLLSDQKTSLPGLMTRPSSNNPHNDGTIQSRPASNNIKELRRPSNTTNRDDDSQLKDVLQSLLAESPQSLSSAPRISSKHQHHRLEDYSSNNDDALDIMLGKNFSSEDIGKLGGSRASRSAESRR